MQICADYQVNISCRSKILYYVCPIGPWTTLFLSTLLSHYGITDTNRSWLKSYLSDRIQVAFINGSLSTSMTIETGVPQGSILGPLLFLIYLNDLHISLEHCKVNMYADDTAFYTPATMSNNICDIIPSLQSDLSNVSDWLDANKLSLHIGKNVAC